uniref:Uncharacterized protein n=1 Tax=Knipowitschia caucasica TaxID=637954 RepID=A0AAV2KEX1_KNICA
MTRNLLKEYFELYFVVKPPPQSGPSLGSDPASVQIQPRVRPSLGSDPASVQIQPRVRPSLGSDPASVQIQPRVRPSLGPDPASVQTQPRSRPPPRSSSGWSLLWGSLSRHHKVIVIGVQVLSIKMAAGVRSCCRETWSRRI